MKRIVFFIAFLMLGVGCNTVKITPLPAPPASVSQIPVVAPLDPDGVAGYNPAYRRFGEFFDSRFAGRFSGYHTGEDSEITPEDLNTNETQIIPVRSIAEGTVVHIGNVSGYGGLIILRHEISGEIISSLYGHLDLSSSSIRKNDTVKIGQFLANLGAAHSADTDGARQHLHFALWRGIDIKFNGYVKTPGELDGWINPFDFLKKYGAITVDPNRWINSANFLGRADPPPIPQTPFDRLSFDIPDGWDIEYVPSIQALNVFDASGSGAARERSQVFIRYFDAAEFLTLPTVTVYSAEDTFVGGNVPYEARRYDVEKKQSISGFPNQPSWRNKRHIVTDFRGSEGFTRYYVVAASPDLDPNIYQQMLTTMAIMK